MADTTKPATANDPRQNPGPNAPREDNKPDRKADRKSDEIQFFDTTIAKLVERDVPDDGKDGEEGKTHKEWVEVMSDNLYPGEKLKREVDEEDAKKKAEAARKDRAKDDNKN
jgi:hypothetical protein